MMSGVPLKTCWAFNKLWDNKFSYKLHLVGISTESNSEMWECLITHKIDTAFPLYCINTREVISLLKECNFMEILI
jgi:hypothetical protein